MSEVDPARASDLTPESAPAPPADPARDLPTPDARTSGSTSRTDFSPLWAWIREREAIRARKEDQSLPPPWTADPILGAFRFCNVRREDDRVTRWIAQHVRAPHAEHPLLWLMLCICRQVNWPDSIAQLIMSPGAWPSHDDFAPRRIGEVLNERKRQGEKIYTGAYMIPAPTEHGADKQDHIAQVVIGDLHRRAISDGTPIDGADEPTLQAMHAWIRQSSGWGNFLAYQAVVDMRFCPRLLADAPDRHTWAAAGPGTIRGLNRLHGRSTDAALPQEQARAEMRQIYAIAQRETGVPLDFSDVPNVLCETDKYLRVQRGEGKPRARYVPGRGA